MTDTTNKPGDTLDDNVRYLLSRCPWTVQDMSGERTGSRAKEDLAGSLAITLLGMEQTIRDLAEAIAEVQAASTALEGRKAWARMDGLLKRCRTSGVAGRCPHCDDTGDVHRADGEWLGTCKCPAGLRARLADGKRIAAGVTATQTPSIPCGPLEWRAAVTRVYVAARADSSLQAIPSELLEAMKDILLAASGVTGTRGDKA